jgi:hypothetical protein
MTRCELTGRGRPAPRGLETRVLEVVPGDEAVLLGLRVKRPVRGGFGHERTVSQVLTLRNQRVVDIRGHAGRPTAAIVWRSSPFCTCVVTARNPSPTGSSRRCARRSC